MEIDKHKMEVKAHQLGGGGGGGRSMGPGPGLPGGMMGGMGSSSSRMDVDAGEWCLWCERVCSLVWCGVSCATEPN
jgi:hypothetical protein